MFGAVILVIYISLMLLAVGGAIFSLVCMHKDSRSAITPSDAGSALLHKALRHLVQACDKHHASCPYKEESLGPMITFSKEVLGCDAATKGLERMASLEDSSMTKNRAILVYMWMMVTLADDTKNDPNTNHIHERIIDMLKDHCTCQVNRCWLHNKGAF